MPLHRAWFCNQTLFRMTSGSGSSSGFRLNVPHSPKRLLLRSIFYYRTSILPARRSWSMVDIHSSNSAERGAKQADETSLLTGVTFMSEITELAAKLKSEGDKFVSIF